MSECEKIIGFGDSLIRMWKDQWIITAAFLHGAAMSQQSTNSDLFSELVFLREVWWIRNH